MIRSLLVFAILLLQSTGDDGPPCSNYHSDAPSHRCACGRAMNCEGHPDDPEDAEKGVKRCSKRCKPKECRCVGPCATHLKGKTPKA